MKTFFEGFKSHSGQNSLFKCQNETKCFVLTFSGNSVIIWICYAVIDTYFGSSANCGIRVHAMI